MWRTSWSEQIERLLTALGYRRPPALLGATVRGSLRARARVVRWLPRRRAPLLFRSQPVVRGYPDGYEVSRLGTFAPGCPVPREGDARHV